MFEEERHYYTEHQKQFHQSARLHQRHYYLASIYAIRGNRDKALYHLERAIRYDHWKKPHTKRARTDEVFDPYRDDPAFEPYLSAEE